jgi:CRP-like cAMP-binding protein
VNRVAVAAKPQATDPLIRRLSALASLSPEIIERLTRLEARPQTHPPGFYLQHEAEAACAARVLLSGWACRQHYLSDGRRQIFAFIVPGDTIGIGAAARRTARTDIVALTPISVLDGRDVEQAVTLPQHPALRDAIENAARLDDIFLFNQITRIGRQTAYERMAHLLLELQFRLKTVGLADETSMPLPLTQDVLADALGLSTVHVNRTLKQFRREELLEIKSGKVRFFDVEALRLVSDFQPPKLG